MFNALKSHLEYHFVCSFQRNNFKRKANRTAIDYDHGLANVIMNSNINDTNAGIYGRTSNMNDIKHSFESYVRSKQQQMFDEKKRKTQSNTFEAFESLWNPNNQSTLDIQPIDENQLFGDYVAHELRQLRKENQRMAKLRIARVLLEMGEAENTAFAENHHPVQSLF